MLPQIADPDARIQIPEYNLKAGPPSSRRSKRQRKREPRMRNKIKPQPPHLGAWSLELGSWTWGTGELGNSELGQPNSWTAEDVWH